MLFFCFLLFLGCLSICQSHRHLAGQRLGVKNEMKYKSLLANAAGGTERISKTETRATSRLLPRDRQGPKTLARARARGRQTNNRQLNANMANAFELGDASHRARYTEI